MILPSTSQIGHHHKVTNITVTVSLPFLSPFLTLVLSPLLSRILETLKSLIERVSFLVYSAHVWRVKKFDSLVRLISFFTFVSGRKSLEIENSNSWHYHRSFLITSLTLVYLLYDSTQTILPYISEQYLHLWQMLTLS